MKKLYKSKDNKIVSGILGGLGEYTNIDPTVLRLIFLVMLVMTGIFPFVILYFIATALVPQAPTKS